MTFPADSFEQVHWLKEIDCRPDYTLQPKSRCGISSRVFLEIIPPIKGGIGSDLLSAITSILEKRYPCHPSLDSFERNACRKGTRHV